MVSRYKWLEPRHMVNICDRWDRDKTDDLQHAFLQRCGLRKLGEHLGHLESDHAARCGSAAAHRRHRARHGSPAAGQPRIGSRIRPRFSHGVFSPASSPAQGRTLWTFVNRNEYDVNGRQIAFPYTSGMRYYDCVARRGIEARDSGHHRHAEL